MCSALAMMDLLLTSQALRCKELNSYFQDAVIRPNLSWDEVQGRNEGQYILYGPSALTP